MDPKETLDLNDQTSTPNGEDTQTQYVEINWEQISLEELKKSYRRQSDYTKKSQELAKEKKEFEKQLKQLENNNEDEDVKAAEAFLKSKGYLTKEEMQQELERIQRVQKDEILLQRLLDTNPSLKQHETAIRKIAEVDNRALEDIVVDYNFISTDKLSKAKESRDIVGGGKKEIDNKPDISSMTPEQWEAFKAKNGIGKKWMFINSTSKTL